MEEDESQSGGSQSSVSYDEASYDGRAGKIEYSCQDDEVIAAGVPGATMYDQDIREMSVAAKLWFNVLLSASPSRVAPADSGLYQPVDKYLSSKKKLCQQIRTNGCFCNVAKKLNVL